MKRTILFFAALAAFVSCNESALDPTGKEDGVETQIITITADCPSVASQTTDKPSSSVQSKTQLNDKKVLWSPGDVVKVCFEPAYAYKQTASYGYSTEFTALNTEASASAIFKGEWSSSTDRYTQGFIVYPNSVKFSSTRPGNSMRVTTTVSYTIPEIQEAVEGSFAPNLNPSWALVKSEDMNSNSAKVTFKNLCALIRINLPETDYGIKSINIESGNISGGVLTGTDLPLTWEADSLKQGSTSGYTNTTVTLEKEDGSLLTPGASYYAVVWSKSHEYLTLTFKDRSGNSATKTVNPKAGSSYITPEKGTITTFNISSLEFDVTPFLNITDNNQQPLSTISLGAKDTAEDSFIVAANNVWTASLDNDSTPLTNGWLTIRCDSEQNMIYYQATANTGITERSATITVTSAGLTKTITVTQPPVYYQSSTGEPTSAAASLEDGALYMIYFATGSNNNSIDTYCWRADYTTGDVSAHSISDKTAKATGDLVFKYHKANGLNGTWQTDDQKYLSAITGYLQSMYNDKYLAYKGATILDFAATSTSAAVNLIFANQWSEDQVKGSDIDVYSYASKTYETKETIYWTGGTYRTSGNLDWGSTSNVPRKWFFVKVEEVE